MKRHNQKKVRASFVIVFISVLLMCGIGGGISLYVIRLADRTAWETEVSSYPTPFSEEVEKASATYGVPPEIIYSVMRTESFFKPEAESHAGAIGLMQIMPVTLEWVGFLRGESYTEERLKEPEFNIDCGVFLLGWLYERYDNWNTVFAAYNAGYARVNGWLKDESLSHDGILDTIPIGETKAYVESINRSLSHYQKLYISDSGRLSLIPYEERQRDADE